jgi:hypothetical protein
MNSYQLKQNNAQKVQRPLLNFKASKDKAKDYSDLNCLYLHLAAPAPIIHTYSSLLPYSLLDNSSFPDLSLVK